MIGSESSWFQVFVPVAMAGQMSQACLDTLASPPWRRAPGIYLGERRTARLIRRLARGNAGRLCVTPGLYSCEQSMLQDPGQKAVSRRPLHLSERHETRIGQEIRPGVWQGRRIWTSTAYI